MTAMICSKIRIQPRGFFLQAGRASDAVSGYVSFRIILSFGGAFVLENFPFHHFSIGFPWKLPSTSQTNWWTTGPFSSSQTVDITRGYLIIIGDSFYSMILPLYYHSYTHLLFHYLQENPIFDGKTHGFPRKTIHKCWVFPGFSSRFFAAALRIAMTMKLRSSKLSSEDGMSWSKAEDELKMWVDQSWYDINIYYQLIFNLYSTVNLLLY